MLRTKVPPLQFRAKRQRVGRSIGFSEKRIFKRRKNSKLRRRIKARMIGRIVRGARKTVEGQDRRPVTRRNDPLRDGKILVVLRLAGLVRRIDRHCFPA